MREAAELSSSPSPDYTATPLETDLFEWHFTLRGPPNSPYAEGIYHGRITLPSSYPLRPPSFRFSTPSGRFEANREICLSISGHHEETWQPAWGLRTALVALRSFMVTDSRGQVGGLDSPEHVRRRLAAESRAWGCPACGSRSNEDIMAECAEAARKHEAEGGGRPAAADEQVPAELKMGFRDEMEKEAAAAAAAAAGAGGAAGPAAEVSDRVLDAESAELAEGFVQTAPLPVPIPLPPTPAPQAAASPASPPARPVAGAAAQQGVPLPTRTVPLVGPRRRRRASGAVRARRRGASNDAVPVWVDRLIMVVGVLLAAMVVKVFLGV